MTHTAPAKQAAHTAPASHSSDDRSTDQRRPQYQPYMHPYMHLYMHLPATQGMHTAPAKHVTHTAPASHSSDAHSTNQQHPHYPQYIIQYPPHMTSTMDIYHPKPMQYQHATHTVPATPAKQATPTTPAKQATPTTPAKQATHTVPATPAKQATHTVPATPAKQVTHTAPATPANIAQQLRDQQRTDFEDQSSARERLEMQFRARELELKKREDQLAARSKELELAQICLRCQRVYTGVDEALSDVMNAFRSELSVAEWRSIATESNTLDGVSVPRRIDYVSSLYAHVFGDDREELRSALHGWKTRRNIFSHQPMSELPSSSEMRVLEESERTQKKLTRLYEAWEEDRIDSHIFATCHRDNQ